MRSPSLDVSPAEGPPDQGFTVMFVLGFSAFIFGALCLSQTVCSVVLKITKGRLGGIMQICPPTERPDGDLLWRVGTRWRGFVSSSH